MTMSGSWNNEWSPQSNTILLRTAIALPMSLSWTGTSPWPRGGFAPFQTYQTASAVVILDLPLGGSRTVGITGQ
jgi:hypothetical protein